MDAKAGVIDFTVKSLDDEAGGPGEIYCVLSAPTKDRDGEVVASKAFEPLPEHITIDVDHDLGRVHDVTMLARALEDRSPEAPTGSTNRSGNFRLVAGGIGEATPTVLEVDDEAHSSAGLPVGAAGRGSIARLSMEERTPTGWVVRSQFNPSIDALRRDLQTAQASR